MDKNTKTEIIEASQHYAITHGLVLRDSTDKLRVFPTPFTLYPSCIKKSVFEEVKVLCPLFNILVDKISRDPEFILSSLESTAKADEFTRNIYNIYKKCVEEGIAQPFQLGIHRSDYMLHSEDDKEIFQQVEINTISSAFACQSTITQQLHQYICTRYGHFNQGTFEPSDSFNSVPHAIYKAHTTFGNGDVVILVCQEGEKNISDQKHLEHTLWEKYKVPVYRFTLGDIYKHCTLDEHRNLIYKNKKISVVYYRAGYTPNDYKTQNEWDARLLVERSTAIKCPSAAYHLIGTKKMQQIWAMPNVLEKFLSKEQAQILRKCFTEIYSLDDSNMCQKAIENYKDYLLKPQREGGGNLIFGEKVKEILSNVTQERKDAYILMKRIKPKPQTTHILRDGEVFMGEAVFELGTFGLFLGDGKNVILNEYGGYLLRTKFADQEDGGVASGVAAMSSITLI